MLHEVRFQYAAAGLGLHAQVSINAGGLILISQYPAAKVVCRVAKRQPAAAPGWCTSYIVHEPSINEEPVHCAGLFCHHWQVRMRILCMFWS